MISRRYRRSTAELPTAVVVIRHTPNMVKSLSSCSRDLCVRFFHFLLVTLTQRCMIMVVAGEFSTVGWAAPLLSAVVSGQSTVTVGLKACGCD